MGTVMIEHFLIWLEEKGLSEKYLSQKTVELSSLKYDEYITGALNWHTSAEGYDYWLNVNYAWHEEAMSVIKGSFINFLRGHGAYDSFIAALGRPLTIDDCHRRAYLILRSFVWTEENGGYTYWYHLSNEWMRYYKRVYAYDQS